MQREVSAIVVSHNSRRVLMPCLGSLLDTGGPVLQEVLLVDNLSDDGCATEALERYPEVRLVTPPERQGYAANVNLGIRNAEGRYVLVANPDLVFCPNSLSLLVRYLQDHPKVGIVGPKLVNPDGSLQLSCRRWHTPTALLLRRGPWAARCEKTRPVRHFMMSDWDHSESAVVDWLLGACLLARREALEAVGPMDSRFFLYFEDVDWCLRMHKAGWHVAYCPEAVVVHHHQKASQGLRSPAARHHLRSLLKYILKHRGRLGMRAPQTRPAPRRSGPRTPGE
ncbi:MAG TPA: glycosyltransferase family 2 protein [Armatimonadota bacterium]|jgi:hypothetical protein